MLVRNVEKKRTFAIELSGGRLVAADHGLHVVGVKEVAPFHGYAAGSVGNRGYRAGDCRIFAGHGLAQVQVRMILLHLPGEGGEQGQGIEIHFSIVGKIGFDA